MSGKVVYERRLTLFVDFLGFKDLVEKSVGDNKILNGLVRAIADATETANIGNKADFHATQFSDCLVLSYRLKTADALFEMVNKLSLILVRITARGYLIRGGLTYGDLVHTDKELIGPAMIRAYQLESQVAKWPRVILDPEVFDDLMNKPSASVMKTVKKYLKRDKEDDFWYFDYISSEAVVNTISGEYEIYPEYLGTIAGLVEDGLKSKNPGVLEKYIWLHKRYKSARKPLVGLPGDHPDRRRFPGFYEAFENLPSLNKEASAAKDFVAKAKKKAARKCKKG
ncbi:hypothetical protein Q083_03508 [Pseudomonas aeruginosa M8A.4]|uniref:hypothetical protein n=1 Tax=Pseudomonas aeruginosa TaxID=287 RepID=UPI0003B9C330|nr:hypothetical protein [Pseudomonas aeruginosa]ERX87785.1 hypothetical protein Q083_03508 [Pseudomonas aeruginosa M8A.4]MCO2152633.1 hypothetical protein [Pseudomonas aeruginosa]MCT5505954.1 hypothetical protein [Pseudomonas aeruginosa]HCF3410320.1 hypothetical protein [Pseudomonas aeruginosa]HCF7714910.1 hypothetical protein [Pseudomonas aeruginosa]